jgi:hypothetical protein
VLIPPVLSRIFLFGSVFDHRPDKEACMSDMGLERPVPDSVEEDQDVIPEDEEPGQDELRREVPLEADEADRAEQQRELELDEDDYR